MSVSIYYSASRIEVLSENENKMIGNVIEKYSDSYLYKDTEEDFFVYNYNFSEPETIFRGSTKLPLSDDTEETIIALQHWAACLSEIRRLVPNAEWSVHMDDVDLIWDETDGWDFPLD